MLLSLSGAKSCPWDVRTKINLHQNKTGTRIAKFGELAMNPLSKAVSHGLVISDPEAAWGFMATMSAVGPSQSG